MTTTVGNLPAATSIATTDLIPVEQGGVLKKATPNLLPFVQSGTASFSETLQSRGRWLLYITDKLSDTDRASLLAGTTVNIDTALTSALSDVASGGTIFFPDGNYKVASSYAHPANVRFQGQSRAKTKFLKAFNGTMCTSMGDSASIDNMWIDGDGANFSGKGILISSTNGKQSITNSKVVNFDGNCIEFTVTTAGSQFNADNVETWQTNGATGNGKYAIVNADAVQASAVPKSFKHIETAGLPSFDFGGSNDVFITNSFLADLNYSANTKSVHIAATRLANQTALTVNGANNSIVGCDVLPVITLASGATSCVLGPNSWNTAPFVTDNSASSTNMVTHPTTTYTPTLTQSSSNPTLNNSTLTGRYTREGGRISVAVEFTVGSSISFGSGNLQFSLPVTRVSTDDHKCGQVLAVNSGTPYTGIVEIPGAQAWARMQRDGTGVFTQAAPAAWASGSTMRFAFSYSL